MYVILDPDAYIYVEHERGEEEELLQQFYKVDPDYDLIAQPIWMFSPGPASWILNWLGWQLAYKLRLKFFSVILRTILSVGIFFDNCLQTC